MFCTNCGAKLDDGSKFCPSCGEKIIVEVKETVNEVKETVAEEVNETVAEAAPVINEAIDAFDDPDKTVLIRHTPSQTAPRPQPVPQPVQQPVPQPVQRPVQNANPYAAQQPVQNANPYSAQNPYGAQQYSRAAAPQNPYGGAVYANAPANKLPVNYSFAKYFWLGIITLGIYDIVMMCKCVSNLNTVARKYDGKKTMSYALVVFVFSWLTFGILPLVWWSKMCKRMGRELRRRNISYSFGAGKFWIFNILLSFTVVCPMIFMSKYFKAINALNGNYNAVG